MAQTALVVETHRHSVQSPQRRANVADRAADSRSDRHRDHLVRGQDFRAHCGHRGDRHACCRDRGRVLATPSLLGTLVTELRGMAHS